MKIRQKMIFGFLVIVLLVGAVGILCLHQLHRIAEPLRRDIPEKVAQLSASSQLDGLAQFIRYYDEVLTQSARNYAFTQDKKWEQRYRDVEPELDRTIKEAIEKGDTWDKEFFCSIDQANLALVKMEYEAIELVNKGQAEKANEILGLARDTGIKRRFMKKVCETMFTGKVFAIMRHWRLQQKEWNQRTSGRKI